MNVAIIDADLIRRTNHRFPNLVSMKLSGYHKELGDNVVLKLDYENLESYDKVYISKVFTDTEVDDSCLSLPNVSYGGTGFFYSDAPPLPDEIEHHMPDYHLYDEWVNEQLASGKNRSAFKYYLDYSIGRLTRGCFRKCSFCVNQKYDRVLKHSELSEFYDSSRKKICLIDDNFLGYSGWKDDLIDLIHTKKPFTFRQGLDERLLTDEKCELLFSAKYDGEHIFSFDNIEDYDIIESKLKLIRKYTDDQMIMFCTLVGYEGTDLNDVINMYRRIELMMKYHCKPFLMIYRGQEGCPIDSSEFRGLYKHTARWCNQPSFYKKKSFREWVELDRTYYKNKCASYKALTDFENLYPDIAAKYFDMKYEDYF